MSLLDFQIALGRLVRAPDGRDPFRALHLDEGECSCLEALTQSAGYRFTVAVQRSWCVGRATSAGYLTLSILSAEVRTRLLNEWTNSGGGTSSFIAAEADALLNFIANLLPDPSHELTVCRLEQATLRANEGATDFRAPDPAPLDSPQCVVRRGRHAGIATFHGEPHRIVSALLDHKTLPQVSPEAEVIMLFGPGLERLCRAASSSEVALWERLTETVKLTALLREGHRPDDIKAMLHAGVAEYGD